MPALQVLKKGNPAALQSLGEDHQGLVAQADGGEHFEDLVEVVPVNLLSAPAESFEALLVHRKVMAQHGRLALAEAVHINHRYQIVEVVVARQCRRFPHGTLGAFAVAQQDVSAVVQIVQPRAQSHADADAQTLAQRTGGHIDKWEARSRMAFEVVAELAQLEQFLHREQSGLSPCGV